MRPSRALVPTHRPIGKSSTNITNELLTLEPVDQATNFTALIDTSTTTTQGLIGSVQSVQLPVQISGSFTDGALTINTEPAGGKCNAVSSMLITDLHNLLIAFPEQLSTGVSWKDSTDVQGCQAGVPTSAHTTRSYVVSGSASYEGRPVLVILRTDTTRAKGEGGTSATSGIDRRDWNWNCALLPGRCNWSSCTTDGRSASRSRRNSLSQTVSDSSRIPNRNSRSFPSRQGGAASPGTCTKLDPSSLPVLSSQLFPAP